MQSQQGLKDYWKEDVDRTLLHQGFLYILEAIYTELISWHYNDPLTEHFRIKKLGNW